MRRLAGAAYFVGAALVGITLFDLVLSVWPLQLGEVGWRYGAAGIASQAILTPLIGVLIALATASLSGHQRTLRILGGLTLAAGVLALGVLVLYSLDAVQASREAPPDRKTVVIVGAIRAGLKLAVGAIALGWLGIASLAGSRRRAGERSNEDPAESRILA